MQLVDIANDQIDAALAALTANRKHIIDTANSFCARMVNRGGGVQDVIARVLRPHSMASFIVVHLHIDVQVATAAS